MAFYDAVKSGAAEPVAMRRIFGFTEAHLTKVWRSRLRALAR